nr:cleavage/polyadenylation specificity factor, 25kDa subunit [Tanacetum cinerariifolium]
MSVETFDIPHGLLSRKPRVEALKDGNLRSCLSGRGRVGETMETRRGSRVETTRRIRVGSLNVGSLTGKLLEIFDALECHKVDIACFQETKWKGYRNKKGNGYNLWYSGSYIARNEVGIIVKASLKDNIVHVNRCSDRIISLTLEGGRPMPRILWKNLSGDAIKAFRSRVTEGFSTKAEIISASDADFMWNILASIIKDAAKDTLCTAIGTSKTHTARRESWWLTSKV